jgi:3-oxoadipate CoA-transferase beta subunit
MEIENRLSRAQIAWRAARDLDAGQYVNLGMGMPVLVASHVSADRGIIFHSENGIVGVGPVAQGDEIDPDFVDAGSQNVTLNPGAAIVDSVASFAMIRGGHLDVTLLGGFEVANNGDLANWDSQVPGKGQLVGGAMDLAAGAKSVRVMMDFVTKKGAPRFLKACTLPITGQGVVDRVYTDLAIVAVRDGRFVVLEHVVGVTPEQLQAMSGAPLDFPEDCAVLSAPDI